MNIYNEGQGPACWRDFQVWPFCLYCRKASRIKFGLLSGSLEFPREIRLTVKPLFYFLHRHNWWPSFDSLWHLHSQMWRLQEGVVRPKLGEPWGPLFQWPPQFLRCWYFLDSWGWWGWMGWRSTLLAVGVEVSLKQVAPSASSHGEHFSRCSGYEAVTCIQAGVWAPAYTAYIAWLCPCWGYKKSTRQ